MYQCGRRLFEEFRSLVPIRSINVFFFKKPINFRIDSVHVFYLMDEMFTPRCAICFDSRESSTSLRSLKMKMHNVCREDFNARAQNSRA